MKKLLLLLAFLLLFPVAAQAAVATVYIDTGGCQSGSTTQCSGTTDSSSATISGASATITCSATTGPAAAPGCSLTGSPDLSGVVVDGSQAIFLNCATNSNQKIFFINAIDNTSKLVGTTVTPTGCTAATSDWGIGGRMIYASANIESAVRPGDTIQFNNTPATKSTAFFTARVSGDNTGNITLQGKSGVRPVLETTNTSGVIAGGSVNNWHINNLELKRGGVSGNVVVSLGGGWIFTNVKWSAAPTAGSGISSAQPFSIFGCELTGIGGDAITSSATALTIIAGNYIHDNSGNGITFSGASTGVASVIINNVIGTNAGRGIQYSGAPTAATGVTMIYGNTIYGNANSGLEVADADQLILLTNNIFMNNGDAAGEYNVEWTAGSIEISGLHSYNLFYTVGGGGSGNVLGLTVNSTESTSDPLFIDAANGNFSLQSGSPAKATGYPGTLLGSASVGYMSMGAVQLQSGGARQLNPGIGQ